MTVPLNPCLALPQIHNVTTALAVMPSFLQEHRLEPHAGGTRFSYDHTGFTGLGGAFMATLLGHVRRKKMLRTGLPPVLDDLDEDGTLRRGSTLRPKSLG